MEFALNIFQLLAVFAGGLGFLFIGMSAVFVCLILFWEYAMTKRLARIGMEKTIIFKRLQKQGQRQGKEIKALREKDKQLKGMVEKLDDNGAEIMRRIINLSELNDLQYIRNNSFDELIKQNKNNIADIIQNTLALKVPLVKIKEK